MSIENSFEPVQDRGWRLGFANLLNRENRKWWSSSRWWVQSLIWLIFLTGFVILSLYLIPNLTGPDGAPISAEDPISSSLQGFFGLGSLLLALGITILMQDELIGEKQSGTAEWVLSKPASRSAFILSKLFAHTLGMLVVMIAMPSLAAYLLFSLYSEGGFPAAPYLAGLALLTLHTFFYLTLSLMLGVLFSRREILLAVSLFSLLGGSFIRSFLPQPSLLTPWFLADIGFMAALGVPIPQEFQVSIAATLAWIFLFIFVALWRFRQHEFS
jgi:ABC-2 type transport system permease protein